MVTVQGMVTSIRMVIIHAMAAVLTIATFLKNGYPPKYSYNAWDVNHMKESLYANLFKHGHQGEKTYSWSRPFIRPPTNLTALVPLSYSRAVQKLPHFYTTSVSALLMPRLTLRLTLHHQICLQSKIIIRQKCPPSKVVLHENVFHQRSSSIKGHLPPKFIFHRRSSSTKAYLPSKFVFYQQLNSTKGHFPPKVIWFNSIQFNLIPSVA